MKKNQSIQEDSWRKLKFKDIYEAQYDDIWKYCLRRVADPSQAEETLADTFAVAWQKLDAIPKGSERPWLFAVARNHIFNSWRKNQRSEGLNERLRNELTVDQCRDFFEQSDADVSYIFEALSTLKEKDQELLRLVAWEELTYSEIAIVVGSSVNAVATRVHRARQKLKKKLQKRPGNSSYPSSIHRDNEDSQKNMQSPSNSQHVVDGAPTMKGRNHD